MKIVLLLDVIPQLEDNLSEIKKDISGKCSKNCEPICIIINNAIEFFV